LRENSIEKHMEGKIMGIENGRVIQFPGKQEKVAQRASRYIQNIDGINPTTTFTVASQMTLI
jgi:hypothetical protein